jgi:hypothetical protein
MSADGTLTPAQAARAVRRDIRTVRRWLAAGMLEGAYRDAAGGWHIPRAALLEHLPAGASPDAPSSTPDTPSAAPVDRDELERLRAEVAELRLRVAHVDELRRADAELRRALEANLDDARQALRMLEARPAGPVMGAPSGPVMPTPPTPEVAPPRRRRWARRGSA